MSRTGTASNPTHGAAPTTIRIPLPPPPSPSTSSAKAVVGSGNGREFLDVPTMAALTAAAVVTGLRGVPLTTRMSSCCLDIVHAEFITRRA